MRYTVIWKPLAERALAECYVNALEHGDHALAASITNAVAGIDTTLLKNPESVGESRSEGKRVLIEPPLTVTFRIREADRQVWVLTVQQHQQKRR
jgi:hypothetical protein